MVVCFSFYIGCRKNQVEVFGLRQGLDRVIVDHSNLQQWKLIEWYTKHQKDDESTQKGGESNNSISYEG